MQICVVADGGQVLAEYDLADYIAEWRDDEMNAELSDAECAQYGRDQMADAVADDIKRGCFDGKGGS